MIGKEWAWEQTESFWAPDRQTDLEIVGGKKNKTKHSIYIDFLICK